MKNLKYKGVDIMKFTKDTLTNQPTEDTIRTVVKNIKKDVHPTHIAISVPLNETIPSQAKPLSVWDFTRMVTRIIHEEKLNVLHRGTFCEIEGIWGYEKAVGEKRKPQSYYFDKIREYISKNPDFFEDGDIWAPLPERTENIWSDQSSFLPHAGGIQSNYVSFFNELRDVSDDAFSKIGKSVITGMTANNWSEVNSGWLPKELFIHNGIVSFDHYGINHTPEEMDAHLTATKALNLPMFHQEWSDYWNASLPEPERLAYLRKMYEVFTKFVDQGDLIGFNYWGGWPKTGESILNNDLTVNSYGKLLGEFYGEDLDAPTTTHSDVLLVNEGDFVLCNKPCYLTGYTIISRSSGTLQFFNGDDLLFKIRASAPEGDYTAGISFSKGLRVRKTATGVIVLRYTVETSS